MMTTPFQVFLSERQTAEALAIGRTLLRRMMAEGRIQGTHVGRRLVFHVDEVRRFADEMHRQARASLSCPKISDN